MTKTFAVVFLLLLVSDVYGSTAEVRAVSVANGFAPSKRAMAAISNAAARYDIPVDVLTAIALIESGANVNAPTRTNKNGTHDFGMMQINTVNLKTCKMYDVKTPEGSAFCAALLLSKLKRTRPTDWYGAYHSKTVLLRDAYKIKLDFLLNKRILVLSSN